MKLLTNHGQEFELLKATCRDHLYSATRTSVKQSLKTGVVHIRQYRREKDTSFVVAVDISAELKNGQLRLGCHYFDRKTSRQILRWAGVKA